MFCTSFISKIINLDITVRCTLLCSRCTRQKQIWPNQLKKLSEDIPFKDYVKITEYFQEIVFSGTVGDPIFHPRFIEMLELNFDKNIITQVNTAASHKSEDWYTRAFKANPKAKWIFGIDGLPKDSHTHRVNQDGEFLFKMMLKAKDLGLKTEWQHIVFNYNQDYLDKVKQIAGDNNLNLNICLSSRWRGPKDPLKPRDEFIMARKPGSFLKGDILDPKCFKGHPLGHTSQGYIVPCCWMTSVDVEKEFPDICNKETLLSNIDSIEEILDFWKKYENTLRNNPNKAYGLCWEKCNSKNLTGRKTYDRV